MDADALAYAAAFRSFLWGAAFKFLITIFFVCLIPAFLNKIFSGLD
jgi:hypothetical protein